MRTFSCQPKGIQEFVIDRFDDLANAGQQAPQSLGSAFPPARLMWRRHDLDLHLLDPSLARSRTGKTFIGDVAAQHRLARAGQVGGRRLACRKQRCSQDLIMTTGEACAIAGNHSQGLHAQQQMEAFIPTQAITPANVGLPCQPAGPTSLAIWRDGSGTIEHLIEALLPLQQLNQVLPKGGDGIAMLP